MTSTTTPTLHRTPGEVIDAARTARDTGHTAAVAEVETAVQWALLHPCASESQAASWGEVDLHGEGPIPLAGPGAPLVAEFAAAELGAALGIGVVAAKRLIGESLELTHRLPRLWDAAVRGLMPVWKARAIAAATTDLDPVAVAHADRLLAATPRLSSRLHALRLVDEARLYHDPDRAAEDERTHLDQRGV